MKGLIVSAAFFSVVFVGVIEREAVALKAPQPVPFHVVPPHIVMPKIPALHIIGPPPVRVWKGPNYYWHRIHAFMEDC